MLRIDYFYLPFMFNSLPSPIIVSALFVREQPAADSCSVAFKILEEAGKGKKGIITFYPSFMGNTVV